MHNAEPPAAAAADPREPRALPPVLRWLLWLIGVVSLGLALLGLLLPGVPTTPFVLLAAACFARASPRMHRWMLGNRWIGPSLRDWEQHRRLTLRIKAVALVSMTVMVGISLWTFDGNRPVQAALLVGAVAGIWVVVTDHGRSDRVRIVRTAQRRSLATHQGMWNRYTDNVLESDPCTEPDMTTNPQTADFEALDACHQQVLVHLCDLDALARQLEEDGIDAQGRQRAAAIDAFFCGTSREHHADEERSVFPMLLESHDPKLVVAVQTLQQDHGWIEKNWVELSPQLRAIALGNTWPDATGFRNGVGVFVELCRDHIAPEETLIYPESKARWAAMVENRVLRPPL